MVMLSARNHNIRVRNGPHILIYPSENTRIVKIVYVWTALGTFLFWKRALGLFCKHQEPKLRFRVFDSQKKYLRSETYKTTLKLNESVASTT